MLLSTLKRLILWLTAYSVSHKISQLITKQNISHILLVLPYFSCKPVFNPWLSQLITFFPPKTKMTSNSKYMVKNVSSEFSYGKNVCLYATGHSHSTELFLKWNIPYTEHHWISRRVPRQKFMSLGTKLLARSGKTAVTFEPMVQFKILLGFKCSKAVLHSKFYDCSRYLLPFSHWTSSKEGGHPDRRTHTRTWQLKNWISLGAN